MDASFGVLSYLEVKEDLLLGSYIDAIAGATIDDCEKVRKDLNYELALNDSFIDQDYV